MNISINQFTAATVAALVTTASLVAVAGPVRAADVAHVSVTGAGALEARVHRAARQVCAPETGDRAQAMAYQGCVARAVAQARLQLAARAAPQRTAATSFPAQY